jgi:hypothetical protein
VEAKIRCHEATTIKAISLYANYCKTQDQKAA